MILLKNKLHYNKEELWYFDESRFGTHSKLGHGWYKKGTRTPIKIKLGYSNFYLYSIVNPITGKSFSLILPKVNTICMNIFLSEFAKTINRSITIVMDGATWHRSSHLRIPDNIKIIIQPSYSPELNPVERLWLYIKNKTIKNRLYHNLADLEDRVASCVNNITEKTIRSICKVNYN